MEAAREDVFVKFDGDKVIQVQQFRSSALAELSTQYRCSFLLRVLRAF